MNDDSTRSGDNNEPQHDEAFARLQASDPAAGVEPREGFAEATIAAALADTPTSAPVTDLAVVRERRRPRWIGIAAAAAAAVVVGGASFGLGASTAGPTVVAGGSVAPISMTGVQGGTQPGPQGASAEFQGSGLGSKIAADSMPWFGGRNYFTAEGLSEDGGQANSYGLDPRSASTIERVAALASALGVEGTPELRDGAWFVGPQDGTGTSLYVGLDGSLSFSYYNSTINPWDCAATAPDSGASDEMIVEPCTPTTPAPGEDAAYDALRAVLAAAGHDVSQFELATEVYEGSPTRTAQAWRVIDGLRTDLSISVEVSGEGMVSAYGFLAGIVDLGSYEIVSEQEAFERLSDPRFGAQMTAWPMNASVLREGEVEEYVAPTEPPATPSVGSPLSWSVNNVHIVSARLGLGSQWQPDGSVLIVPAYEFTDADGGTWSVIAVTESLLDFGN